MKQAADGARVICFHKSQAVPFLCIYKIYIRFNKGFNSKTVFNKSVSRSECDFEGWEQLCYLQWECHSQTGLPHDSVCLFWPVFCPVWSTWYCYRAQVHRWYRARNVPLLCLRNHAGRPTVGYSRATRAACLFLMVVLLMRRQFTNH